MLIHNEDLQIILTIIIFTYATHRPKDIVVATYCKFHVHPNSITKL